MFSNGNGRMSLLTGKLFAFCMLSGMGTAIYGYDGSSFSGLQSLPSFTVEFGVKNPLTGAYALATSDQSFLNSIALIGKGLGPILGSFVVSRWGHRWGFVLLSLFAIVGAVIQVTSHTIAQFAVSRIILYGAIGLVEVVVATYQADIVPAPIRGMVVGTLQMIQSPGGLLASGMNRAFSTDTRSRIWIIPSSIQFVFPVIILLGVYFLPDSPRWLVAKGRHEEALQALHRVRRKIDVDSGACDLEMEMIKDDVARQAARNQGGWLDLFRGTNLRRTHIVCTVFTLQQVTGQAFVSSYAVPFWISAGLGANAFNYSLGLSSAGFVGCIIGSQLYDRIGRRTVLMFGSFFLFAIFFCIGGIGLAGVYTADTGLAMVALVIMFAPAYVGTWGAVSYIVGSEMGSGPLREKTMAIGASVNVVWQFATTYAVPYILVAIGARLGFIFGSVCFLSGVWVFFCLPETRNRTLEEIDEIFEARVPARKFASYQTGLNVAHIQELAFSSEQQHSLEESNEKDVVKVSESVV